MPDSERAIIPFRQIPRDLNCVTAHPELSREHLIPFANHPSSLPHPPAGPILSPGLHQHQVRMSRIEVQRSNSRNKIIAITIAISSRTTEPWWQRDAAGWSAEWGKGWRRTTAAESWTTKYVNVVLTPPCTPSAIPMPQTVCCRSFGDYTNEVVQREKCTFRYKAGPRASCATHGIKNRGGRAKVKSAALPRSLRPPRRGQYFLCWKLARRRMDFHRRGVWALQERNSFLSDTRSRIGISPQRPG